MGMALLTSHLGKRTRRFLTQGRPAPGPGVPALIFAAIPLWSDDRRPAAPVYWKGGSYIPMPESTTTAPPPSLHD